MKAGPKTGHSRSQEQSGLRPGPFLICLVRRQHTFFRSRRLEGYETCVDCGFRRKAANGAWFAAPSEDAAPDGVEPVPEVIEPDQTYG